MRALLLIMAILAFVSCQYDNKGICGSMQCGDRTNFKTTEG